MNAIIEAVEHDNSCADADLADEAPPGVTIDYASRDDVSVQEAIQWASQQRCPVTLYIYDAADGTISAHFHGCGERFWQDDMGDS